MSAPVPSIAWATGSLYPRKVSIYRQSTELAIGNAGYLGENRTTEVVLFANLQASIQAPSVGARRIGDDRMPYDAPGPARWNVFVPPGLIANGAVKDRDIVIDDNGDRYQVAVAYWTPLAVKLQCIRLEA